MCGHQRKYRIVNNLIADEKTKPSSVSPVLRPALPALPEGGDGELPFPIPPFRFVRSVRCDQLSAWNRN